MNAILVEEIVRTLTQVADLNDATLYLAIFPLKYNNGQPIDMKWLLSLIRTRIVVPLGGGTLLAPSDGLWIDGKGTSDIEDVLPLIVLGTGDRETVDWFTSQVNEIGKLLGQERMFIVCLRVLTFEPI